jgi:hypothetical protein
VLDYLDLPVGVGQVEFTRIIKNLEFTKTGSKFTVTKLLFSL